MNYVKGSMYDYIRFSAMRFSNMTALEFLGKKFSYREMLSRIDNTSRFFSSIGIKDGDCVTLCLPNCMGAVISIYALNRIGAVVSPIHPLSSSYEIKTYTAISHSQYVITLDTFWKKFDSVFDDVNLKKLILTSLHIEMPLYKGILYKVANRKKTRDILVRDEYIRWDINYKPSSDDVHAFKPSVGEKTDKLAVILFSGGTTGRPKGVMLSNGMLNSLAQQIGDRGKAKELGGKVLGILPIFHGYGLSVVVHSFLSWGCHVILVPKFTTESIGRLFRKKKPAYFQAVPRILEPLLSNPQFKKADLSGLKQINSGGDKLKDETLHALERILKEKGANTNIVEGYGLTETVSACMAMPDGVYKRGSIGKPLPGMLAKIVSPGTLMTASVGEDGEICVRGPNVMMGYIDDEVETDKALKRHDDGEIWLHTGDLGYVDEEGFYYFKERIKRIFKVSGMAVFPVQIEEVLNAHPQVIESYVIGVPDDLRGQRIKAIVVLDNKNLSLNEAEMKSEIIKWCRGKLIPWRCPREIEFIGEMPKTKVGKVSYQSIQVKYGE